eukprot:55464-Eustigmatos_ZCMA.PRE.6
MAPRIVPTIAMMPPTTAQTGQAARSASQPRAASSRSARDPGIDTSRHSPPFPTTVYRWPSSRGSRTANFSSRAGLESAGRSCTGRRVRSSWARRPAW